MIELAILICSITFSSSLIIYIISKIISWNKKQHYKMLELKEQEELKEKKKLEDKKYEHLKMLDLGYKLYSWRGRKHHIRIDNYGRKILGTESSTLHNGNNYFKNEEDLRTWLHSDWIKLEWYRDDSNLNN